MLVPQKKLQTSFFRRSFDKGVTQHDGLLPEKVQLRDLMELQFGGSVEDVMESVLLGPIRDLTSRRGKRVRGQLVSLGYQLASPVSPVPWDIERRFEVCANVAELIHAGSLIVDDIQDGSQMRRGKPSLHIRYGLPVALNAGNWLYFWPLYLLEGLGLPQRDEVSLYRYYHRTLLRAHFGQALDVGVRLDAIDQSGVAGLCLASMELKTGALMGFALVMGGVLGGASENLLSALNECGHGLGIALQMFDDLGNLNGSQGPGKRYEDLTLYRPSWVWACAADRYSKKTYAQFVAAVRKLPDTQCLEEWLGKYDLLTEAKRRARAHLDRTYEQLDRRLGSNLVGPRMAALKELRALGESIAHAYE